MMRHCHLLFAALLGGFFVLATPAQASLTIQDYLDIKLGRKEGVDSSVLSLYLWGALDALLIANQAAETLGTPRFFCEPESDVELSIDDFRTMVDSQLEKLRLEPDFDRRAGEMTVGQLALIALIDKFPCRE
ncbi:hypothetical protein HRbin40_02089 [bacterium HR40]|nr:hypothetical protein HRbin40_02089 [bacterium HR40]